MDTPSANTRHRRHLEARRVCLASQIAALREQALSHWHCAYAQLLAGNDPSPLERLACDVETQRRRTSAALLAIDAELGECVE